MLETFDLKDWRLQQELDRLTGSFSAALREECIRIKRRFLDGLIWGPLPPCIVVTFGRPVVDGHGDRGGQLHLTVSLYDVVVTYGDDKMSLHDWIETVFQEPSDE